MTLTAQQRKELVKNAETILFRISPSRRAGIPYFAPDTILQEYALCAQRHQGRLLYTTSASIAKFNLDSLQHLIVCSGATKRMIHASIDRIAPRYTPDEWDPESPYQIPEPWNTIPARWLFELSDVKLGTFQPDEWDTISAQKDPTPSIEWLENVGGAYTYIRPALPLSKRTEN